MKIEAINIKDFKGIKQLALDLANVNLLIGGNNAGKSSIIQAIHFTISALKSTKLYGKGLSRPATTLGVNQFSYLPTNEIMEIRHKGTMTQSAGPSFEYTYKRGDDLLKFKLNLYRGKNSNISLSYAANSTFYRAASDLVSPFSVFVPGLAGLPLNEERRANSIVQAGIAQGDANLYLRNVLLRLSENNDKLSAFHTLMRNIFPGFETETVFDENVNQFIKTTVRLSNVWIPLEMAGTGCLQALQLAAYVILYEPKLLLLDEPDAHLHPGNQKLLVDLLFRLSETTGTQIVLASHSRHVYDSVFNNELGQIHWLQDGTLVDDDRADVPLLVDLGALDKFEELAQDAPDTLIFLEDEKHAKFKNVLQASGVDPETVKFVSYNGVDNLESTSIVVDYFLSLGESKKALIYRDGDCMTADEKQWLEERYRNELHERSLFLISKHTDIEHYFCNAGHIAEMAGITIAEAQLLIDEVIQDNQAALAVKLTNKRNDLKFKALKKCQNRASSDDLVESGITFEMSLGKFIHGKILDKLHESDNPVASLVGQSTYIGDDRITAFTQEG